MEKKFEDIPKVYFNGEEYRVTLKLPEVPKFDYAHVSYFIWRDYSLLYQCKVDATFIQEDAWSEVYTNEHSYICKYSGDEHYVHYDHWWMSCYKRDDDWQLGIDPQDPFLYTKYNEFENVVSTALIE